MKTAWHWLKARLWDRLDPGTRNAIIAGRNVAAFTFVGTFGAQLAGALQQIVDWSSSSGQEPFPDLSILGYGFVSAAGGAFLGALVSIYRWAQAKLGMGRPPSY